MRKHLKHVGFTIAGLLGAVVVGVLSADPQESPQGPSTLVNSDSALIQHLWRHDYVFRGVFETCTDQHVTRGSKGRQRTFTYSADCRIRRPASERDDCPTFHVVASGTVDTPEWASVRKWSLELSCSA